MSESTSHLPVRSPSGVGGGARLSTLLARPLAFTHDLLWVVLSSALVFWLAGNLGPLERLQTATLNAFVLVMLPTQAITFLLFRLARGIWRFVSLADLLSILKAVLLGYAAGLLILHGLNLIPAVPRAALVLYPFVLTGGLVGARVLLRLVVDGFGPHSHGRRALILGAGAAGEALIRDLIKHEGYRPVGILDDAPEKQGRALHGVPVLGRLQDLSLQLRRKRVDVVLIAMPSAPGRVVRELYDVCARSRTPCITLPTLSELASGRIGVSRLRAVQLEDLLGREVVEVDLPAVRALLKGKRILVTGAGGSIGSELVRQIAANEPEHLVLVDSGEFNLYRIEREVKERFPGLSHAALLVDVRERARLEQVFAAHHPAIVVHAAAYKHVPLVESNPFAGVDTNVFGTRTVADLALAYGAQTFVQVSTDKAVNPRNVMGASKRVAEIYCQTLDRQSGTSFITTRFGNVLGSAGSVVPLFRHQIERGGPVTVTHPDITRYFMTIPEAVSLILQAAAMGQGGEIFVLDMGEPIRIADLASQMIHLSGYRPGEDIEILYTGLRPGEKLTEELFHVQEALASTGHPKIMRAQAREIDLGELQTRLRALEQVCRSGCEAALRGELRALVPEALLDDPATVALLTADEPPSAALPPEPLASMGGFPHAPTPAWLGRPAEEGTRVALPVP